jgi:hypothetical protein
LKAEIKAQWLAALRSGEYEQAKGYLNVIKPVDHAVPSSRGGKAGMCCLGVLCDLAVRAGVVETEVWEPDAGGAQFMRYGDERETTLPPYEVVVWAGMSDLNPHVKSGAHMGYLTALNDTTGCSFAEIADAIEASL